MRYISPNVCLSRMTPSFHKLKHTRLASKWPDSIIRAYGIQGLGQCNERANRPQRTCISQDATTVVDAKTQVLHARGACRVSQAQEETSPLLTCIVSPTTDMRSSFRVMRTFWKVCVFFVVYLPSGTLRTMNKTPPKAADPNT